MSIELTLNEIKMVKLLQRISQRTIATQLLVLLSSKGITEGFIIVDDNEDKNISPADITHQLQEKEINFNSTE